MCVFLCRSALISLNWIIAWPVRYTLNWRATGKQMSSSAYLISHMHITLSISSFLAPIQILVSVCAMCARLFRERERESKKKKQMYRYSEFSLKWSNFSNRNKWTICMNEWNEWGETNEKTWLVLFSISLLLRIVCAAHQTMCVYPLKLINIISTHTHTQHEVHINSFPLSDSLAIALVI